jgi:type IV secretion system protein VirB11
MPYGENTLRHLLRPIRRWLDDPAVTEIIINKPHEVGVETRGEWSWHHVEEYDFNRLDAIALLAGRMTSREADREHPLCGSTLPDGQRIQICRPPSTPPGVIAMCIRKPPQSTPSLDDPDRVELFSLTNARAAKRSRSDDELVALYRAGDYRGVLRAGARLRKTIGACGLTGSGKTQTLRSIMQEMPERHRLVTVESDPEFGDAGAVNRVALFYNEEREGQHAVDVVKAALRMYPSTIAFQEVRGAESFALMRAILSGHNSFTSWHSAEGGEIAAMCLMLRQHPSCTSNPDEQLTALVKSCFDIIVYCERDGPNFNVPRLWLRAAEEEAVQ